MEDNEAFAESIKYTVQKREYETEVYYTGEDCIKNLYKNPDIIILDFMLGSMNGLDVLKQVKAINPDIHVIFLSGQEEIKVGVDSLKYGAHDYVIKEGLSFGNLIVALNKISKLQTLVDEKARRKKVKRSLIAFAAVLSSLSLLISFLF